MSDGVRIVPGLVEIDSTLMGLIKVLERIANALERIAPR